MGRSGYFSLNLSANSVMRGRLDTRRTLKSLVADLRSLPLPDRNFHSVRAFAKTGRHELLRKTVRVASPHGGRVLLFQFFEDVGSGDFLFFLLGPRMLQDGNNCVVLLLPDCGAGR